MQKPKSEIINKFYDGNQDLETNAEQVGWLQRHAQKLNFIHLNEFIRTASNNPYILYKTGLNRDELKIKPGVILPVDNINDIEVVYPFQPRISILDVGCGLCDFYPFLKDRHNITYTGWDINDRFLKEAKAKYPEIRTELRDITDDVGAQQYDYVFAAGIFNVRIGDDDEQHEYVTKALVNMHRLCKCASAATFLSVVCRNRSKELFFYHPMKLLGSIMPLISRFNMNFDFGKDQLSISTYKKDYPKVDGLTTEEEMFLLLKYEQTAKVLDYIPSTKSEHLYYGVALMSQKRNAEAIEYIEKGCEDPEIKKDYGFLIDLLKKGDTCQPKKNEKEK